MWEGLQIGYWKSNQDLTGQNHDHAYYHVLNRQNGGGSKVTEIKGNRKKNLRDCVRKMVQVKYLAKTWCAAGGASANRRGDERSVLTRLRVRPDFSRLWVFTLEIGDLPVDFRQTIGRVIRRVFLRTLNTDQHYQNITSVEIAD